MSGGAMLEAYHKRHPKPKTIAKLKKVLQVIWDSLPQGPIDKVVRVLKATEGLCCSWGWTFRTFIVTAMSWLCYFCLNDVILLRDCLNIFERATIARWQHCNADNYRTL